MCWLNVAFAWPQTGKHAEQDCHKVLSVFSCRGDFLLGYQDTERSVVCVSCCVSDISLRSCSQTNCEWVWVSVFACDGGLDLSTWRTAINPLVQVPPLQWVLDEWHNLHRCPLISVRAGALVLCQLCSFRSLFSHNERQHGAHTGDFHSAFRSFVSL